MLNPVLYSSGYLPTSFFFACLWTETESRSISTQKKKTRTRPISSHLDRTSLANQGLFYYMEKEHCFLAGHSR